MDDARLVVANARSAHELGAQILTRTRCVLAKRNGGWWDVVLERGPEKIEVQARALVNAAGPWARALFADVIQQQSRHKVRLVKGSHIVVPRLYKGDHAYLLQNRDRRMVLMIPFQEQFTLIGTTDIPYQGDPASVAISDSETGYLCDAVNRYLKYRINPADAVWRYSGVRALYDDGHANPSRVTRDYKLIVDTDNQGRLPLLSVFGGKITTYRKLAEQALDKLAPWFAQMKPAWTPGAFLPGGDIADFERFAADLVGAYPRLPQPLLRALARRHGSLAREVLTEAREESDLGLHFGAGLYQREVDYFIEREWAKNAEDILWRRTKAGLHLNRAGKEALDRYVFNRGSVAQR